MRRSRSFPKPTAGWSPRPNGPRPTPMRPTRNSAWEPPRLRSGRILCGSNFESEVYPAGLCAERSLLFYAQANYPDDPVETLAIASDPSARECYPCGQCRQVMVDVERRQGVPMRVVMSGGGSASAVDSAARLLPFAFVL